MRKLLILASIAMIACSGGVQNDTPLPNSIQQMQLNEIIRGEEADDIITNLHQKVVTDQQNIIGKYEGTDGKATLYLTIYDDADSPVEDLDAMAKRIQDPDVGSQMGFQHVRQLTNYGDHIYMALQNNRAHYFYVEENMLYWLDVNPQVAMPAIKQLVQ